MATCKKIRRLEERICIGSLNRKAFLYLRSITEPISGGVDYGEDLANKLIVWSMIATTDGITIFDSSNMERTVSHNIYIRYRKGVTQEDWLEIPRINETESDYYDILKVENLDENYRFLKLFCTLRGDTLKQVNLA